MESHSLHPPATGGEGLHLGVDATAGEEAENGLAVLGVLSVRWRRLLSLGGVLLLVVIEITDLQRSHRHGLALSIALAALAVIAVAWLISVFEDSRWLALVAAALAAGTLALELVSPTGGAIIAAIVTLVVLSRLPQPAGRVAATAFVAVYLGAIVASSGWQFVQLLTNGLGLAFAYLAFQSFVSLRREQERTRALLVELQESRDAQVQAAALNERSRIAREIHDVLAHTLAALAVQLEGTRVLLQRAESSPEVRAAVERAHRLAREGLDETRRAVSALRGDRIPGSDQLRELVDQFTRDTAIPATFELQGESRQLGSEAQLALYRAAQEALTNIRRHAHPREVKVVLRYLDSAAELEVVDAGRTVGALPSSNGGYGLTGMRERAELLGGWVEAAPTADGFRVCVRLPE